MNEASQYIQEYKDKGALLDANLLLVYVVGKTGESRLSTLHHTKQYVQDFQITEVSNLALVPNS